MTDNPKTWGQMTPEEKGALLLSRHEGKTIQFYNAGNWVTIDFAFNWYVDQAYRVKPEPKHETVRIYGQAYPNVRWNFGSSSGKEDTHIITFDTLDGEPVCDSIRMEKIS